MAITTFYLAPNATTVTQPDVSEIHNIAASEDGLLWLDISEMSLPDAEMISKEFDLHFLSIEDALEKTLYAPKVQRFDDVYFLITHGIDHTTQSEMIETAELDMWIGKNFVITSHHSKLRSIETIKSHIVTDRRVMTRGPEFLSYMVLDALIGDFNPTLERMRDVADELEEQAIRSPSPDTLEGILRLKRSAMRLRRAITPHREIFQQMTRPDFGLKDDESRYYYGDLYDRVIRISESNSIIFERADNAISLYQNSISIRQNEVMKVLAIVAGIFLPLGLFAGIFGMNFESMPGLQSTYLYFVILGFSIFAVVGSLWWYGVRGRVSFAKREIPLSLRLNVMPNALTPAGKRMLSQPTMLYQRVSRFRRGKRDA